MTGLKAPRSGPDVPTYAQAGTFRDGRACPVGGPAGSLPANATGASV